jgi:hypothetical protein
MLALLMKDNEKAELFGKVYQCCKPTIFSLWPPGKPNIDTTNEGKEE